jgi:uncharacterized protein (DUF39 family)
VEAELENIREELVQAEGEVWEWNRRIEIVDRAHEVFTSWVMGVAERVAGRTVFIGGAIKAPLMEKQLIELKKWRDDLYVKALEARGRENRVRVSNEFQRAKYITKAAIRRANRRLYHVEQDERVLNAAGEAKRVARTAQVEISKWKEVLVYLFRNFYLINLILIT